ncbi:MAG: carboxylase [uncultured Thermomicrobiales bacterium]|uniref:Carboxylase n=1 Tax=uncultured Thermomicrobiales bacterium TaxID=1645740 RepID=A0A6J4U1E5_9BACT|nr:MAG: carboxylase [uncultured Thermomicrobiales bacterium]
MDGQQLAVAVHGEPASPNPSPQPPAPNSRPPRVLLLAGPASYRAGAFATAARGLGLEVVLGMDLPETLAEYWHVPLGLDLTRPEAAADKAVAFAAGRPLDAVVAVDDGATLAAAAIAARLGLPHNDPASALAARDKLVMRTRLAAGGVPVPWFRAFPVTADPAAVAAEVLAEGVFPCVVKPLRLSGSRGVIRADDVAGFVAAFGRTRRLLLEDGHPPAQTQILVEEYLPGVEVALEGLLTGGTLRTLALFDKPDPLDGPFFEETIYVTPSRLPADTQATISARVSTAAAALGLREGPVHAELRINDHGVWLIEIAGRSIGGLCATILEFGAGVGLEELILRHAVGLPLPETGRTGEAAGVLMIPIPKAGILRGVSGTGEAAQVPGVTGVEITAKLNHPLVPLPEGASYLGFVFAKAATPAGAEAALRAAHERLSFRIDPAIALTVSR